MITAEQARHKTKEQQHKVEQENLKITNLCLDAVEKKIIKAIDGVDNSIKFRFNELGVLKINSLISELLEKKLIEHGYKVTVSRDLEYHFFQNDEFYIEW